MARLIGRWVQEVARKVAQMPDFQGQGMRGQPATGKTRHAINVTVRAKPPARKVGLRGGRMSNKIAASEMKGRCGARSERTHGRTEPIFLIGPVITVGGAHRASG